MENENENFLKQLLPKLRKEIPYKWRVQSFSKNANKPLATVVAYIDQRDLMDILDEYCIYGWQKRYEEVAGNLFCYIGVNMPDGTTHWRADCGVESQTEAEKGRASDAAKRAGVNWGIGRFLYDLGMEYVPANEAKTNGNYPYCVDEQGKKIYDITKYVNDKKKKQASSTAQPTPHQPAETKHPELLPGTDKWATCVKGIADGVATIDRIKLKNSLSEENEGLLKREAIILQEEIAASQSLKMYGN